MLEKLARGFSKNLQSLEENDANKAKNAVLIFSAAHDSLIALETGISSARNTARWTLRGRFVSREVKDIASRYERHAVRLYASSLLFAEAFADALRKEQGSPPASLHERLASVASGCAAIASDNERPVLLPRGGYLATCSCSHFMKEELFVQMLHDAAADANVQLRQIEARQQSPDHPILWNVPETYYLKFYIFQVV